MICLSFVIFLTYGLQSMITNRALIVRCNHALIVRSIYLKKVLEPVIIESHVPNKKDLPVVQGAREGAVHLLARWNIFGPVAWNIIWYIIWKVQCARQYISLQLPEQIWHFDSRKHWKIFVMYQQVDGTKYLIWWICWHNMRIQNLSTVSIHKSSSHFAFPSSSS